MMMLKKEKSSKEGKKAIEGRRRKESERPGCEKLLFRSIQHRE
jgi:hypothetical protein